MKKKKSKEIKPANVKEVVSTAEVEEGDATEPGCVEKKEDTSAKLCTDGVVQDIELLQEAKFKKDEILVDVSDVEETKDIEKSTTNQVNTNKGNKVEIGKVHRHAEYELKKVDSMDEKCNKNKFVAFTHSQEENCPKEIDKQKSDKTAESTKKNVAENAMHKKSQSNSKCIANKKNESRESRCVFEIFYSILHVVSQMLMMVYSLMQ